MTTVVEPDSLATRLADDAGRFEPEYGGYLSNHGPMGALALATLQEWAGVERGAARDHAAGWLTSYATRLEPADGTSAFVLAQRQYRQALEQHGMAATLKQVLPGLISGWVRDAYHPLIRLAYGIEAGLLDEIAAGLAYLKLCGADPTVERLAATATLSDDTALAWLMSQEPPPVPAACTTFTERAQHVIGTLGGPVPLFHNNGQQIARAALCCFAATHDFFALHLVTGSHAFRLCRPYAGPHADAIQNLGVLTGYLAIGAPEVPGDALEQTGTPERSAAARTLLNLASEDDEHDLKLAHTAIAEAEHWQEGAFVAAAARYLGARSRG